MKKSFPFINQIIMNKLKKMQEIRSSICPQFEIRFKELQDSFPQQAKTSHIPPSTGKIHLTKKINKHNQSYYNIQGIK